MPHSLLQLWKQKGGALEELLVDGNPLIQPSVQAAIGVLKTQDSSRLLKSLCGQNRGGQDLHFASRMCKFPASITVQKGRGVKGLDVLRFYEATRGSWPYY